MDRSDPFGFELDFIELRGDNVSFTVAPKHLHRVLRKRHIAWIARFQRSFKDDYGVCEILISFVFDNVVLGVVFQNVFKVGVLPVAVLQRQKTKIVIH